MCQSKLHIGQRPISVDDQKKQIQIELNQQALADTLVLTLNPTATEDVTFSWTTATSVDVKDWY